MVGSRALAMPLSELNIHPKLRVMIMACLAASPAFGQCGSSGSPSDTAVASGGNFNVAGTWVTNTGASVVPNSTFNTCIVNGTGAAPATVFIISTNSGSVLNLQVGANNTLSLTSFTGLAVIRDADYQ